MEWGWDGHGRGAGMAETHGGERYRAGARLKSPGAVDLQRRSANRRGDSGLEAVQGGIRSHRKTAEAGADGRSSKARTERKTQAESERSPGTQDLATRAGRGSARV